MAHESAGLTSFVLFELAGTAYVVPSQTVQQIEMVDQITPVPNSPPFVDGVVFVRGQVVPVINLRVRFGFERVPNDVKTRLIVVAHEKRTVGLLVDSAREFVSLTPQAIAPAPESVTSVSGKILAGIASLNDRIVLVLDVAELLTSEDTAAEATMS